MTGKLYDEKGNGNQSVVAIAAVLAVGIAATSVAQSVLAALNVGYNQVIKYQANECIEVFSPHSI